MTPNQGLNPRGFGRMGVVKTVAALGASVVIAVFAGCGSDESGQDTTAAQGSIATPTSPLATTSTAATTPATPTKTKTKTKQAPATGGTPGGCTIPARYQDFKFSGVDCATALGIANAWDANPNECNTIDNPNSPEGYKRTCSMQGYTCQAKRDVHSDGRFVSCTQGGASIRFTWFPS
jgi:hypothetical protein